MHININHCCTFLNHASMEVNASLKNMTQYTTELSLSPDGETRDQRIKKVSEIKNELCRQYLRTRKLRLGNPSCFIFQMLRGSIMCYTNGWKVRTLGFNRGTTPNYLSKHGQEATFLKASDSFQNEEINLEGTFPCKSKLCNFQNLRKRITI